MEQGRDIGLEPDASERLSGTAWTELLAAWFAEQSELLIRELERERERG